MSNNNFDFNQLFQQFDPQQFNKKVQEMFNLDMSAVSEAQNKNIELLMNTNKSIAEGSRALMERQAQMLQQAMTEATEAAQSLAASSSPQEAGTKQAELMRVAYEKALENMTEISEMAKQTQEEVAEKINSRVTESLQELKESIAKIG